MSGAPPTSRPILNMENVSSPYLQFKYSIRTQLTRRYYERRLKKFLDYIDFERVNDFEVRFNHFAEKAIIDNEWAINGLTAYLYFEINREREGEITAATLRNFVKALKLFFDSCNIPVNWKRLTRGFPRARSAANDRAPRLEEIKKLIEYPDRRIKPIILTMASSGCRIGAWDYLRWKHIIPIENTDGKIVAAKMIVYAGDIDEYYSAITPEAYFALKDWINYRVSHGEKVTGDSWVMRDKWQTSNIKYGAKFGLATNPKKLKSPGVKRLIEHALWSQGLRNKLSVGVKRHEWKAAHGFRKFFKTMAEQVMKPINVEILMGHDIGLSASYYKPTEKEILDDYLKAVDLLTINGNEKKLSKQIQELKEKSRDNEYIIKGRLEEKDKQLEYLTKRDFLNSSAIADLSEELIKLKKEISVHKSSK